MSFTIFLFLVSAVLIYMACEYFVNGIEWLGLHMRLGETAVGSVLAAFGTALPESAVTFTAVFFGDTPEQKYVGVGSAMGGPLVLATIAYAAVGGVLLIKGRKRERRAIITGCESVARDQLYFLSVFVAKIALGAVAFTVKPWLGLIFLVVYGAYVWRELSSTEAASVEEQLEPLKFCFHNPSLKWVLAQIFFALALIVVASHVFVSQLESISAQLELPTHIVAMVLSPIATELPEIMNAMIWVRQGKERLALANISGSMMIQATVPSALGLFFTPWIFDVSLFVSGAITVFAIIFLWMMFRLNKVSPNNLIFVSFFYVAFLSFVFFRF